MTAILQARRLTVRIGGKLICQQINLDVRKGERWGVLGPNGCGKSTLLQALCGLYPSSHGEIRLADFRMDQLPAKSIAKSIGILFQDTHTAYPQTVWDYCLAGRYPYLSFYKKAGDNDKHIVRQSLELVELDTQAQRPITELSGGEKRRVAIAALLSQTPSIYILDEPANHLDMRHQIKILEHFKHLTETISATVVMSLHDANLAQQYCDHILLMYPDGEILQGTTREMLTTHHLSRLYQHPVRALTSGNDLYWLPC